MYKLTTSPGAAAVTLIYAPLAERRNKLSLFVCADPGEGGGERGGAGGGCETEQGSTNKQKDLGFAPAEMPAGLDFFYVSNSGHKH